MMKGHPKYFLSSHTFFLFVLISSVLLWTTDLFAGDYHNQNSRRPSTSQSGVTLACAQCHTMHGIQGGNSFSLIYSGTAFIYPKLIRESTVVKLCKFCHGSDPYGIGAPILFSPSYNASSGDFNAGTGSFDESCNSETTTLSDGDRRHDIGCDLSSTPPPGFVQTGTLDSSDAKTLSDWNDSTDGVIAKYGDGDGIFSCEFCHDQHGNTNYRNVRPTPYDPGDRDPDTASEAAKVTYVNGSYDNSSSILQVTIDGDADGSDPSGQFATSNITFRSSTNQIAGFCGKCHINFYGDPGDANLGGSTSGDTNTGSSQWRRHPVGGISVGTGETNGHTDPQTDFDTNTTTAPRVINPSLSVAGDEQPFCFTCHRVHGSRNHTNLIFGGPGTSSVTDGGGWGTMMRDTCQQCHNQ